MKPLVVITTRLPPATCGIGTYSWLLRKNWPEQTGATEFLVVEDREGAVGMTTQDAVSIFANDATRLRRELDRIGSADVLLHYAGRAYQRFGFPSWMPVVLKRWKRKFPGNRLMIFFHELPGDFRKTSPHFWLGKLNARTIGQLASIADVVVTNTRNHAAKLQEISGRAEIHLVPVGSNIEVAPEAPQGRDRTEFALFGLPFGRLQTIRLFAERLRDWQTSGRLTRLHLIGPDGEKFSAETDELIARWGGTNLVVHHGVLPSLEVAGRLRAVEFALTNIFDETWSKSTTFMACAANHCPMIVSGARGSEMPLSAVIGADEVDRVSEIELVRRTAALARWYQAHADWPVIAKQIAGLWPGEDSRR